MTTRWKKFNRRFRNRTRRPQPMFIVSYSPTGTMQMHAATEDEKREMKRTLVTGEIGTVERFSLYFS